MTRPTLQIATAAVKQLPNLPGSTRQLLGYLNDESIELKIIVRSIECDQVLAVGVMRVANSPFFGMSNMVQTINDAVIVLGFSNLRMIIVATMMATLKFPNLENSADIQIMFKHALAVAIGASIIARNNALDSSSLFLAGILHDIGTLALMSTYPELHQEARELSIRDDILVHEAEGMVFGFDHAEIGASLCRHWNLPESIVQAIGSHHRIADVSNLQPPVQKNDMAAGVIHISDAIAHGLNLENDHRTMVPPISDAIWSSLTGQQDKLIDSFAEIEKLFHELVVLIAM
jgi:putative nucleotidyltransferase with HDIG domain